MRTSDLEIVKRMAPDITCFIDCFEVRTYLNPAHFFMLLRAGDLWTYGALKDCQQFLERSESFAEAHGTDFFAGVPDSLLKDLGNQMSDYSCNML